MTEADDFAIQSPEEWEPLGVGEDDMHGCVAWVAAEDRDQARMLFRAFRAVDEVYAIRLTRMGAIRGTLYDAREAAAKRPGCKPFRVIPQDWVKEGEG
ncbi:hypothetical protein ACFW2V_13500 [Streptomyces sp. NPDC058947]|uniref:hypothetical protein n=1 Tax=Streptomyces sp. NPDC058947 TaxID=3346675 RepID=UPI00369C2D1F